MSDFEKAVFDAVQSATVDAIIESKRRERGATEIALAAATRVSTEIGALRRSRRSVKWDQRAIHDWSDKTFGEPRSNLGIAIRANEEMAELLRCLATDDNDQAARAEVADVVIVLCRLAERLGGTIVRDVDDKMEVNAKRTWRRRGDGHGHHVREPDAIPDPPDHLKCGICGYVNGHAENCYVVRTPL